jgi:Icc-related predicted phosphoesterase
MVRALIFSDIHNDAKALEKLMDIDADYYFAAGDLVSWARGLDKMGEIMKRRAGRVYVLPGNHESEQDIAAFCSRFGFVNFHGKSFAVDGAGEKTNREAAKTKATRFAGLGYSSPTPFNTPGEYTEEELASRLGQLASRNSPAAESPTPDSPTLSVSGPVIVPEPDLDVLICHAPPLNTALDRIREGLHGGSRAVREYIDKYQPRYFFCGHIHEAEGVVIQMGATRAQNVGKHGYLLELWEKGD